MNSEPSNKIVHSLSTFGISSQGMSFPAIQLKALEVDSGAYAMWLASLPLAERVRRLSLREERLDASRQQP